MYKFKRTTITTYYAKGSTGVETKAYSVEGLDPNIFKGLQVALVNDNGRWKAYEATTGLSITPRSWNGGMSNRTRVGILQIVSNFLPHIMTDVRWESLQKKLDYPLNLS